MTDDTKTMPPGAEDHLYDEMDDGDDYDDHDVLDDECMLGPDGQCGMAGTEHCDFVCPWRDSDAFAGSEAWNRKHAKRGRQ